MPRLFAALPVPPSVSLPLSFIATGLEGARWVEREDYHITLRFMGDVDGLLADQIVAKLDDIVAQPFDVSVQGVGFFGPKVAHSLHALVVPSVALLTLQEDIDRACVRLGLEKDHHKFTPHITVARTKNCKDDGVARWLTMHGAFKTPEFRVDRFALMSSRGSVGGGPYVAEDYFPLR